MLCLSILVIGIFAQQSFADEPERIVGGQLAAQGEFPYQCSLNLNGQHFCGCSIISATQALTAAHCVDGVMSAPYNNVQVVTGDVNSNAGERHAVKTIHNHPDYVYSERLSWVNDISVITLKKPIKFNARQRPVALPIDPPVVGTQCFLSGWGHTRLNGNLSPYLLKMNPVITANKPCQQIHKRPIYDSQVCAFVRDGVGGCHGDSGSPLVCNGRQVGVISWVLPCAAGAPDVYTSVYHHLDFINDMKKHA